MVLQWLRGHLDPRDLDVKVDISLEEDGWMLVDIVGRESSARNENSDLLLDYIVIPEFSRTEQPNDAVEKELLCHANKRRKRNKVSRTRAFSSPNQRFQREVNGKIKSTFFTAKVQPYVPLKLPAVERGVSSRAHKSIAKTAALICDGVSAVKKIKLEHRAGLESFGTVVPAKFNAPAHHRAPYSSQVLPLPSRIQTRLSKRSFAPIKVKGIHKSMRFMFEDFSISQARRDSFSTTSFFEDIRRVSREQHALLALEIPSTQEHSDTVFIFGQGWKLLLIETKTFTPWLTPDQAGKIGNWDKIAKETSRLIQKPSAPHEYEAIRSRSPKLALEWKTIVHSDFKAVLISKMYRAAAQGSMVLYQWALDVWEAPLMYLPVISPLRLRLVPSRLLVPIAALQILWAHLMKLLSLKDKEQGRQIKRFPAPIRQRALIRGRGKSLLQDTKSRAIAEKKANQKCLNKKSLERAHRALMKSRGSKGNRKRALTNGRFNCTVGRRGH